MDGKLSTLLEALREFPNTKLYWIVPNRTDQVKISLSLRNNSQIRQYSFEENNLMGRIASEFGTEEKYNWDFGHPEGAPKGITGKYICVHCGEERKGNRIHQTCTENAVGTPTSILSMINTIQIQQLLLKGISVTCEVKVTQDNRKGLPVLGRAEKEAQRQQFEEMQDQRKRKRDEKKKKAVWAPYRHDRVVL